MREAVVGAERWRRRGLLLSGVGGVIKAAEVLKKVNQTLLKYAKKLIPEQNKCDN